MPFRIICVLLLFVALPALLGGQSRRQDPVPSISSPDTEDSPRSKIEKDMEKRRNQNRQEQIKRDADKLLQLATELKSYVDKSNENVLSMDVIRKAEEIEKYARNVKEKMKIAQ